jgi:hypothetical protein
LGGGTAHAPVDVVAKKKKQYESIILPIILYGYAIWSLTLKKDHRLKIISVRDNTVKLGYNEHGYYEFMVIASK